MESSCSWASLNECMRLYHDTEWCRPSHDDRYLFEMLVLEGAQAGLSWSIVLNKREAYREAFNQFDISYCAQLSDSDLERIKTDSGIIKNMLKIRSVRSNASAVLAVQRAFGSFSNYLWSFVDHRPIISHWTDEREVPAESELSRKLSKDLKKRGFKFVGPVIVYSYLQAIGIVDDHKISCPFHTRNRSEKNR
ncbi:DNA-3-methyladenine glycosylase I [Sporolactobacillus sp. CPB3-1]|uniref:DNA-3-methyladenine glycosylase I n=1 Tax=Sporolactobacillus mangiferae TaxID=2940498 RepID=A0ABT0M9S2_9BACL|nr:DNA-3-methyladenine glycosylase I [Sporolactobacillus mangiferae]MCL1631617.1 DNA-3-methyladenine glycosylase I [Sporolactobacillus mangiferae]